MEWEAISEQECQKLIESMPSRVDAVLKAKGGLTSLKCTLQNCFQKLWSKNVLYLSKFLFVSLIELLLESGEAYKSDIY